MPGLMTSGACHPAPFGAGRSPLLLADVYRIS